MYLFELRSIAAIGALEGRNGGGIGVRATDACKKYGISPIR